MIRSAAIAGVLTVLSIGGAYARDVYIEIGDASLTLNEWSRQTGIQVLFDYPLIKGIYTNKTVCDCTATESLQQLIRHLGLTYDFVNPRTVAVVRSFAAKPLPSVPVYPTTEEYEAWFDRAGYFQPARSYGTDLNVQSTRQ